MSQIDVRILGLDATALVLDKVGGSYTSKKLYEEGSAILLARIRRRFLDTEDPDGIKWNKSAAAIRRQKKGIGNKTLFDTGRLFHSIQAHETSDGFAIGTDVPYAVYHQKGEGENRRVFLGFNQDDANILVTLVQARIRTVING